MIFDAPVNEGQSRWVIDAAKEKYPGKKITHLVLTHHHMDHTGGMRTYVAEGATVIVPAPTKAYFEQVVKAPQRSRRMRCRSSRGRLTIQEVTETMTLKDDTIQINLHNIPNPHSEGMLIGHVVRRQHRLGDRPDLAARADRAQCGDGGGRQCAAQVQHHRRDHRRRSRHHRQAGGEPGGAGGGELGSFASVWLGVAAGPESISEGRIWISGLCFGQKSADLQQGGNIKSLHQPRSAPGATPNEKGRNDVMTPDNRCHVLASAAAIGALALVTLCRCPAAQDRRSAGGDEHAPGRSQRPAGTQRVHADDPSPR